MAPPLSYQCYCQAQSLLFLTGFVSLSRTQCVTAPGDSLFLSSPSLLPADRGKLPCERGGDARRRPIPGWGIKPYFTPKGQYSESIFIPDQSRPPTHYTYGRRYPLSSTPDPFTWEFTPGGESCYVFCLVSPFGKKKCRFHSEARLHRNTQLTVALPSALIILPTDYEGEVGGGKIWARSKPKSKKAKQTKQLKTFSHFSSWL